MEKKELIERIIQLPQDIPVNEAIKEPELVGIDTLIALSIIAEQIALLAQLIAEEEE